MRRVRHPRGFVAKLAITLFALVFGVLLVTGVSFYRQFLAVPGFDAAGPLLRWSEAGDHAAVWLAESLSIELMNIDARDVHGSRLWLGRHEVTLEQYAAFVDASGYRTVAERQGFGWQWMEGDTFKRVPGVTWRNHRPLSDPRTPAAMLAWLDAKAFTTWMTRRAGRVVRLPTSLEWARACQAEQFPSDGTAQAAFAWYRGSTSDARRVGLKAPGAHGLFDLLGNVWEWNEDPMTITEHVRRGRERPLSGGSYLNGPSAAPCSRAGVLEDVRIREPHIGFRIVVESSR
jgi:formylglycine-generating enzyme required for sulfatase activity